MTSAKQNLWAALEQETASPPEVEIQARVSLRRAHYLAPAMWPRLVQQPVTPGRPMECWLYPGSEYFSRHRYVIKAQTTY
jgi:hypothetical protein